MDQGQVSRRSGAGRTVVLEATNDPTKKENEMSSAPRTTSTRRPPVDSMRKIAFAAGVLYLITFIASLPTLGLKDAAVNHTNFVLGVGSDTSVIFACLLDVITALAGVGAAVVLYSVAKRYSQIGAIGYVTTRVMEAGMLLVGVVSLLSLVTLRQDLTAGATAADAASFITAGRTLVAIHNWAFLLGPALMAALNALFLGSVMYRSRLVPRIIPTFGLIGAPLLLASTVAVMFGLWDQLSIPASLATAPIFLWELSLGLWLTFKGFNPDPTISSPAMSAEDMSDRHRLVV
jgi:Domain of unknown function (DUF4386)